MGCADAGEHQKQALVGMELLVPVVLKMLQQRCTASAECGLSCSTGTDPLALVGQCKAWPSGVRLLTSRELLI